MTFEEINLVVAEIERRWRARTPATRVDEVNASYRVGRSEIRRWCNEQNIHLDELSEDFEVAVLRMYTKLRHEFPNEMWEPYTTRMKELVKLYKIRSPRTK